MDRNFFTAMALSMGVFMLYMSYQSSFAPPPETEDQAVEAPAARADAAAGEAPSASDPLPARSPEQEAAPERRSAAAPVPTVPAFEKTIRGKRYEAKLSNVGAAIVSWRLLDYFSEESHSEPIEMITLAKERAKLAGALLTPFSELGLGSLEQAHFAVEAESENAITFAFRKSGITVRKIYDFSTAHSEFGFTLTVEVENGTAKLLESDFELLWPAVARDGADFQELGLIVRTEGDVERGLVRSGGFFARGSEIEEPTEFQPPIDWTGVETRYFVGAVAPAQYGAKVRFEPEEPGMASLARVSFPRAEIGPGQKHRQALRGFIGPKEQRQLEQFGGELQTSISRGWSILAPLVRFFEWLLTACYSLIPNYGIAIILLTLLVRLATLPILSNQMKSMEKMRAVQPRLKELQEKHADDRQKQSEEMMRLYREEGVNPLGGCLPMLLQMPVFIGLFFALQSAIELRQAPFVGWINDLSAPEALFVIPGLDMPFRVLPVLMAGSMVAQQKLQPTAVDPAQARMMMTIMPIMMLVLFYSFPSGLVLYYFLSNVLGIGHQLWVGKQMREGKA